MRILCDHDVAEKYRQAFDGEEWITVTTVEAELSRSAADAEIAEFAAAEGWVLFTTDDDFYADEIHHGLLVYSQIEDPRPGDVVAAIEAIEDAYVSPDEINEFVPDGWT